MNKVLADKLRKDPERYAAFLEKNRNRRRYQMKTPGYYMFDNKEKLYERARNYIKSHPEKALASVMSYYKDKEEYNYCRKQCLKCKVLADYTCQICGASKKDGVRIEAHHIIPKAKGGNNNHELSNLICVCSKCHKDLHRNLRDLKYNSNKEGEK